MITFVIIIICLIIIRVPSDIIKNLSNDTQVILFCLFVINDLHMLLRIFDKKRGDKK